MVAQRLFQVPFDLGARAGTSRHCFSHCLAVACETPSAAGSFFQVLLPCLGRRGMKIPLFSPGPSQLEIGEQVAEQQPDKAQGPARLFRGKIGRRPSGSGFRVVYFPRVPAEGTGGRSSCSVRCFSRSNSSSTDHSCARGRVLRLVEQSDRMGRLGRNPNDGNLAARASLTICPVPPSPCAGSPSQIGDQDVAWFSTIRPPPDRPHSRRDASRRLQVDGGRPADQLLKCVFDRQTRNPARIPPWKTAADIGVPSLAIKPLPPPSDCLPPTRKSGGEGAAPKRTARRSSLARRKQSAGSTAARLAAWPRSTACCPLQPIGRWPVIQPAG